MRDRTHANGLRSGCMLDRFLLMPPVSNVHYDFEFLDSTFNACAKHLPWNSYLLQPYWRP
jgi:hypothetical protein